ncbi:MAG: glycosyltransferase, partial [Candidatus Eremiobacteraeota bacterium]|nr:glycosyltransferase [Candidatus Eremiobacteraeota bacterium]
PHQALFPLCSAVVHHGGAGTTAQGLRAGLPTLVCPFFADQPFWAQRVLQLGCGPIPLSLEGATAEELAQRLQQLGDPDYRRSAQYVAGQLAAEDGPGKAAAIIEAMAAG